jgi:peroxin-12
LKVLIHGLIRNRQREASNSLQEHLSSPLRRHHATGLPPSYSLVALRYILLVPRLAFEALKIVLPTSIFFFKFLEWWYSSDYARTRRGGKRGKEEGSQPPIKAPTRLEPHPDSEVTKRGGYKMGVCPVHDGEIVNATALPSGYVACYRCAHGYVVENGRCPVTFLPAEVGDLRKVVG